MTTAVLSQSHFRGRKDSASIDTAPDWIANEDTNFTWGVEINFRIRFTVQETAGGNPAADSVKLQANKNGGAFADVTTSSTNVKAVDYSSSAEDTSIATKRLGGTGTYVAGRYSEDGSPATNVDMTASSNTEWEFAVRINAGDVANGDTIQLKVVALTGTAITATTVPTVTVSEAAVDTKGWFPPPSNYPVDAARFKRGISAAAALMLSHIPSPPQPLAAPITTIIANAVDSSTVIQSILVYDQTTMPIVPPPAAPAAVTFVATPGNIQPTARSKPISDVIASSVGPQLAAPSPTSTIATAVGETTIIPSSLVYDMTTGPVRLPGAAATPTPTQAGFLPFDLPRPRPGRSPQQLSAFVLAIPEDVIAYQIVDLPRQRVIFRKVSEGLAFPAQPPPTVTPPGITTTIACAVGETTVIPSTLVYDMTAMAPGAAPTPPAAQPLRFAPIIEQPRRTGRLYRTPVSSFVFAVPRYGARFDYVSDQQRLAPRARTQRAPEFRVTPVTVATAPTPTQLGFIPEDGTKPRPKPGRVDASFAMTHRFTPVIPTLVTEFGWPADLNVRRPPPGRIDMAFGTTVRAPFTPTPVELGFIPSDLPSRLKVNAQLPPEAMTYRFIPVVVTLPTQFGFAPNDLNPRMPPLGRNDTSYSTFVRAAFTGTPLQLGFVPYDLPPQRPKPIRNDTSYSTFVRAAFAGTPRELGFINYDRPPLRPKPVLSIPLTWTPHIAPVFITAAIQPADRPKTLPPRKLSEPFAWPVKPPLPPTPTPGPLGYIVYDYNSKTRSFRQVMPMWAQVASIPVSFAVLAAKPVRRIAVTVSAKFGTQVNVRVQEIEVGVRPKHDVDTDVS